MSMHLLSCSKKTLGGWTRHRTHDSHQMQQISQVKGRPTEREHNLTSLVLLIHFQADRLWSKNFEFKKVITTCIYWDVSFFKHETFRPFMLRESKYNNQGWLWAIFEDHIYIYNSRQWRQIPLFNPLHRSINFHILHTVLLAFPMVLTGKICLTLRSFF